VRPISEYVRYGNFYQAKETFYVTGLGFPFCSLPRAPGVLPTSVAVVLAAAVGWAEAGLKWADFNWDDATLTISRGIVNNHVAIRRPKQGVFSTARSLKSLASVLVQGYASPSAKFDLVPTVSQGERFGTFYFCSGNGVERGHRMKIQHCTKLIRQSFSRDLQSAVLTEGFDET
jgi:hypothetical protein